MTTNACWNLSASIGIFICPARRCRVKTPILLTGAGGFLGRHLDGILGHETEVIGADIIEPGPEQDTSWYRIHSVEDLLDLITRKRPRLAVHAGFRNRLPEGMSHAAYLQEMTGFNEPFFAGLTAAGIPLVLISSSAVYSPAGRADVIDESYPVRPSLIYGLAKQVQEALAHFYMGRSMTILRLFNLCGPGQAPGMLLPDWILKVRNHVVEPNKPIRVDHMQTSRDYVDVRDAADAIVRAIQSPFEGQTYNVASGRAVSLGKIASLLEKFAGQPLNFEVESQTAGSDDVPIQRGSFAAIRDRMGWVPKIPFERSLQELWDEPGLEEKSRDKESA